VGGHDPPTSYGGATLDYIVLFISKREADHKPEDAKASRIKKCEKVKRNHNSTQA